MTNDESRMNDEIRNPNALASSFFRRSAAVILKWGRCPISIFQKGSIFEPMKTRELTEKLEDWQKRATETARNVGEVTDRYVHENAWTSVAFAAVLGCIVGYFLASRRD